MSYEEEKWKNERSKDPNDLKWQTLPENLRELKAFLSSDRSIHATTTRTRSRFEDVNEIRRLFSSESNGYHILERATEEQEGPNHDAVELHEDLNNTIRNLRLQAAKPEMTLHMIDEKLSSLEKASKEIQTKREEMNRIVVDVNKQIDTQLEELKAKLEAKFNELKEQANQILKLKLDAFEDLQNKVLSRTENIQSLKTIFIETFQGERKEVDKLEVNLTKLHENKPDIHYYIQALDPFDLRAFVNQSRIRNSLKSRALGDIIDKIQLVEEEIAGLTGLEDFSAALNEGKIFRQNSEEKSPQVNGEGFQASQSTRLIEAHFSNSLNVTARETQQKEAHSMPSAKALKGLGSVLSVRGKHGELHRNARREDPDTYLSPKTRNGSAERIFSGSVTPSSLTPQQNASFSSRQTKINLSSKRTDLSALIEARRRAAERSLSTTPRSPHEWVSSATIGKAGPLENPEGKISLMMKLNAIKAAASKNSTLGNGMESLRKQRETFLKSSFRNWN